jgi:peptidoglycan/xylan/chitin deacetylase (PgdA/CDA1 family)
MNFSFYLHDESSIEEFERKIVWFKKRYELVSYGDIYDLLYHAKRLRNACHLTFDDGWLSTYRIVFPIIKKYKVPISIFVSPQSVLNLENFWYKQLSLLREDNVKELLITKGYFSAKCKDFPLELLFKELTIDNILNILKDCMNGIPQQPRFFINKDELLEMASSGLVNIGAHTLTHPILANESDQRVEKEITESVALLENMLDKPVTSMAYPNGLVNYDFGEREMSIAKKAGLKIAFSVDPGWLTPATNPMSVPRIGSVNRLRLGKSGCLLPSLVNQAGQRKQIRKIKL